MPINAYAGRTVGAFIIAVAACVPVQDTGQRISASTVADSTSLLRDISYFAADNLEGRLTGSPGNDSAAAYIARRYEALGLQSAGGFLAPFDALSAADVHLGKTTPAHTQNVISVLRGTDSVLRDQYVVVGAHYDHLGRTTDYSLDPEIKNAIRNGADDNASGTAAVMELARLLRQHPPKRSVIFANFSGEEQGVLGSAWFVNHSPIPIENIVAMINFDMVGRLRNDKLIVYGRGTASEMKAIVDSVNTAAPDAHFSISGSDDGFGPSDHSSFYAKNIPVLHIFTDLHDDYHRATDDVEKINFGGEARVVNLALGIIRAIADRPARLTFVRMAPPQQTMSAREGSQVYLGSVPDMGAGDVAGLKLTGVRPGSPADNGGLKAGDLIVELGGAAVKDLYTYSDALYSHKPGDKVKIVFMREGKRMETEVTLGKRGG